MSTSPQDPNAPSHSDSSADERAAASIQPLDESADKKFVYDRKLEAEKEYQRAEANGTIGDPSARRNIGANGYTQRTGQKDQLENLHIGGSDHSPQGGNDHETPGENAAGPGFEVEGGVDLSNPTRSRKQEFGDKAPTGPASSSKD